MGLLPPEGRDLVLAGALISITLNPLAFAAVDRLATRIRLGTYGRTRLTALEDQLDALQRRGAARRARPSAACASRPSSTCSRSSPSWTRRRARTC